jgi:hypothetical protein
LTILVLAIGLPPALEKIIPIRATIWPLIGIIHNGILKLVIGEP